MNDQLPTLDETLRSSFEQLQIENAKEADTFWKNLSEQDKQNAFHSVVSRLVHGEIDIKASYRYILYDVFEFGPEMYVRGMDCGYMLLHNSIVSQEEIEFLRKNFKANSKVSE